MKRAQNYVSSVAEKIRSNPEYAINYIKSSVVNHGDTLEAALASAMDQYGHAELAAKLEKPAGNITRTVKQLREGGNIKMSTIREILNCFGTSLEEICIEPFSEINSTKVG